MLMHANINNKQEHNTYAQTCTMCTQRLATNAPKHANTNVKEGNTNESTTLMSNLYHNNTCR